VTVAEKPHPAGGAESLSVGDVAGQCNYAVRAVDAAGNIGPIRVLVSTTGPSSSGGAASANPNTAAAGPVGGAAVVLATGLLAAAGRRRRRVRCG